MLISYQAYNKHQETCSLLFEPPMLAVGPELASYNA